MTLMEISCRLVNLMYSMLCSEHWRIKGSRSNKRWKLLTCFTNSLFEVYNNLSFKETGPGVYNTRLPFFLRKRKRSFPIKLPTILKLHKNVLILLGVHLKLAIHFEVSLIKNVLMQDKVSPYIGSKVAIYQYLFNMRSCQMPTRFPMC